MFKVGEQVMCLDTTNYEKVLELFQIYTVLESGNNYGYEYCIIKCDETTMFYVKRFRSIRKEKIKRIFK